MRLIKRLIELAFVILIISLFMKNKDVELTITYFGLSQPIRVAFWELVTFCVSAGIIIAAVGDFITQIKWIKERRRMVKTDREHQGMVDGLNRKIEELEAESKGLKQELEQKKKELEKKESEPVGVKKGAGPDFSAPLEKTVPNAAKPDLSKPGPDKP